MSRNRWALAETEVVPIARAAGWTGRPAETVTSGRAEVEVEERSSIPAHEFPAFLRHRMQIGDAVLSGAWDPVSAIIQAGTRSWFSHVGVATGWDEFTEAYDYALTPDETDEGVYRTPVDEFLNRCRTMRRIRIMRPDAIDLDRFRRAADHLYHHSPAFPSVGMAMLAMCGLSRPVLARLPRPIQRRATMQQIRWTADGLGGVHCAEVATRLYAEAGVSIRFRRPTLDHHLAWLMADRGGQILPLPERPRTARPGVWPTGTGLAIHARGLRHALLSGRQALEVRLGSTVRFDAADLVMPGDFIRAEPFTTVGEYVRRGRHWIEVL